MQIADQHETVRLAAVQMDDGMVVSTGHYKVKLGVSASGEMQFYGSRRVECNVCDASEDDDESLISDMTQPGSRRSTANSSDFYDFDDDCS